MKKSKTPFLIVIFALVGCTLSPSIANQQTIDILQVTKIGSSVSIFLDFDLNSTSQLDSNKSLAVLVVFTQDEPFVIEATMLFFHTVEEDFLFWMLGDPYTQAQIWQLGVENEHFQTQNELLTLNFIEYLGITKPEINPFVIALIASGEVNNQTNDFRPILEQFVMFLPIHYEFPSIEQPGTTEETSAKKSSQGSVGGLTPGFTILSTVGIFLSTLIVLRFKRKK
ncbi:MAG: hypothetical protein JSW11_11440 [Candidatus Heimdallarchaeota archaeon]|nr:MAG: hypothetical protein JSW11_11440 [Candidatus Heimdallarchaeota archaeon]